MSMSPGPMVLSARMASLRAVYSTHRLAIHGATKIAPDFIPQKFLKWSVTNHFMVIIRGRHRNHGFYWFLVSIDFWFLLVSRKKETRNMVSISTPGYQSMIRLKQWKMVKRMPHLPPQKSNTLLPFAKKTTH